MRVILELSVLPNLPSGSIRWNADYTGGQFPSPPQATRPPIRSMIAGA
jgi:hypothetical protein